MCNVIMSRGNVCKFLFLSLGLTSVYRPPDRADAKGADALLETDGSKACRRNIMALISVVVVAGFAGADPGDLSVFGVKADGDWGVIVVGVAVILVQLYWYVLRGLNLWEDAVVELEQRMEGEFRDLRIKLNDGLVLKQKSANLISNWISFLLVVLSWYFVFSWVFTAS